MVPPRRPDPADQPVGAADAALEPPVAVGLKRPPEFVVHHRLVFGQDMGEEYFVGPFRQQFGIAEDAVVFEGTEGRVVHQIQVPRAGVDGFKGKPQALLVFAQGVLGLLERGDVGADDHVLTRMTLLVEKRHDGGLSPEERAVLGPVPDHPVPDPAGRDGLPQVADEFLRMKA